MIGKALAGAAVLAALAAGLGPPAGTASAQTLNMDMSWGMQQQALAWQQSQAAAAAAAQGYLNHMTWLRANGYTGPSLPTGVTPQTLMEANRRLQDQYDDDNNRTWHRQSQRQSQAVNNYVMQAIRGCSLVQDRYGQYVYLCP
jgi:hypothetical protein